MTKEALFDLAFIVAWGIVFALAIIPAYIIKTWEWIKE